MSIVLDGRDLTIENLTRIARDGEAVELAPAALERIQSLPRPASSARSRRARSCTAVNTGIGEFSEIILNDDQVREFQRYLIYNHAAGIGEPAPLEYVRGAMAGRINVHAHGRSGCRPEITLSAWSRCSTAASRRSSARRARSAPAATWHPCRRSRCC